MLVNICMCDLRFFHTYIDWSELSVFQTSISSEQELQPNLVVSLQTKPDHGSVCFQTVFFFFSGWFGLDDRKFTV